MALDSSSPRILKDVSTFLDGRGQLGKASEVKLPVIEKITQEHTGGLGVVDVDTGKFNKMTASFKFSEYDRTMMAKITSSENQPLVLRGSQGSGLKSESIAATMRGVMTKIDTGAYTPGEKAEVEFEMNIRYYKLEIGGRVVWEFDFENWVAKSDGVDLLTTIRSHLGF